MILYFANEFGDIAITRRLADRQKTLEHESDNGQQRTNQDRNDDTPQVHTGQTTLRAFLFGPEATGRVGLGEVTIGPDNKPPDQIPGNNTYQRCYPGDRVTLFLRLYGLRALS